MAGGSIPPVGTDMFPYLGPPPSSLDTTLPDPLSPSHTHVGLEQRVLARLKRLCDEGMLTKVAYQESPVRYEYRLTQKGREFWDVLAAMWRWGSDWLWPEEAGGAPVVLKDRETGAVVQPVVIDEHSGERLDVRRLRVGRASKPAGR